MMDEGYFVPRGELIDWMNELLDVSFPIIVVKHHQNLTARRRLRLLPDRRRHSPGQGAHEQGQLEGQERL